MPSIAHLFFGGIFGIFLYYISDKKFSKYHVFVLFMNNYLGPDTGWVIGLGQYTHTVVGFTLYAFILAAFYYYFTRFNLKINGIKDIELIDQEKPRLNYLNVYCLVLAGGIMHVYLDGMMNSGGVLRILPSISSIYGGLDMTIEDFMAFWTEGLLDGSSFLFLATGIVFIMGFILVFVWLLKTNEKRVVIYSILWVLGFSILFLLGGSIVTAEHSDVGALIYISIFWLTPLGLCVLSIKPITMIQKTDKPPKARKNRNLLVISIILYVTGIIGLIAFPLAIAFSENIAQTIFDYVGEVIEEYVTLVELKSLVVINGVFFIVICGINLLCAVGLSIKNEKIWKLTVYYHLLLAWTVIGLTIACALSENAVKDAIKLTG
jgi:hypothetical protein